MHDPNSFLMSGGTPSAKFAEFGDQVAGEIITAEVVPQLDYDTGAPMQWDDGSPRLQLKVVLATDERDPARVDDDGHRAVYIKTAMKAAVRDAVRKAGAQGVEPGGWLRIEYIGDGTPSNPRLHPPKKFGAEYQGPKPAAVSVEDL